MGYRAVLVLFLAMSAIVSGSTQQKNSHASSRGDVSRRRELVGTWRLVSRVVRLEDGTAVQDPGLGKTPTGYLMYDSSGHVAAQIMKADRGMAIDCGASAPAPANNSQSINGYDAYFGKYTIDEAKHTVTHHLEGALAAGDVGKNLIREFHVAGDKLMITVRTDAMNEKQVRTLTFERVR